MILINIDGYYIFKGIYPINQMRNVAVNGSVTDRLLLLDMDFVPCPGLLKALQKTNVAQNEAKVVAAFEIVQKHKRNHNAHPLNPQTTEELMELWSRGLVQPSK